MLAFCLLRNSLLPEPVHLVGDFSIPLTIIMHIERSLIPDKLEECFIQKRRVWDTEKVTVKFFLKMLTLAIR